MGFKLRQFRALSLIGPCLLYSLAYSARLAAQQPVEPSPELKDSIAPEVQRIQQALGGSAVNQFPLLQQNASPKAPGMHRGEERHAIDALREAAAQLDASANRLERIELYRQADALRQQAQQLRLDARDLSGGDRQSEASRALRPWEWGNAKQGRPAGELQPSRPNNRQNPPSPSLQPTPQPE